MPLWVQDHIAERETKQGAHHVLTRQGDRLALSKPVRKIGKVPQDVTVERVFSCFHAAGR